MSGHPARVQRRCLAAFFLCTALTSGQAAAAPTPEAVPGGLAIVRLGDAAQRPEARFNDAPLLVERRTDGWYALVGLALDVKPGRHEVQAGEQRFAFTVQDKRYPEQHVRIRDKGKVNLSPENEARVKTEHAEIFRLKRHWRELPDHAPVDTDFVRPADGPLTGWFGARRIFNGQPRAPHVGIDFKGNTGAPVRSVAAGQVLATAEYFFNGRTVFVDHGQGLISMYCHLDGIEVQTGQTLRKGERLGRVGSTGRATGPHLHFSLILNGAMIDPLRFVP